MFRALRLAVVIALIGIALPVELASADVPPPNRCLYPSDHERFGITLNSDLSQGWDVRPLSAGAYHNWWVNGTPSNIQGMRYYPLIHVTESGYSPPADQLRSLVAVHRGATWLVGNEADTVWMGNARPETYARYYHEIYHLIKSTDPTARIGFNGFATVSTLRLAWLDRAWTAYRAYYGVDMPVDVWNVHPYVVNEMVHEWGPQIPPGIENAVGYSENHWQRITLPEASGGSVHASNTPGARAYFAVHGDSITLFLRTGPDGGMVDVYVDNRALPPNPPRPALPVERIDLYAAQPGVLSRVYRDLPMGDARLGDWHHVRVQVLLERNPASSGNWVRVDAAEAASTVDLPTGRLEDDSPLRARILYSVDSYLDIDAIMAQLRMFRRWMLDHGQNDKPLIISEFGVLIGENAGIGYSETRRFMLTSFDTFMNHAVDAELGYPADGNRLLQEWFWYILAGDHFDGARIYSALYDATTRRILPLGEEFARYVRPLVKRYVDLQLAHAEFIPDWPLFAGQSTRLRMRFFLVNRGELSAGPFRVTLTKDAETIKEWTVTHLTGREGANHLLLDHVWEGAIIGDATFTLTVDSADQVNEPCETNNRAIYIANPPHVDIALNGADVRFHRVSTSGQSRQINAVVDATVVNRGAVGTQTPSIPVTLWRRQADHSLILLDQQELTTTSPLNVAVRLRWQPAQPGSSDLVVKVGSLPDDQDPTNNETTVHVVVPTDIVSIPLIERD